MTRRGCGCCGCTVIDAREHSPFQVRPVATRTYTKIGTEVRNDDGDWVVEDVEGFVDGAIRIQQDLAVETSRNNLINKLSKAAAVIRFTNWLWNNPDEEEVESLLLSFQWSNLGVKNVRVKGFALRSELPEDWDEFESISESMPNPTDVDVAEGGLIEIDVKDWASWDGDPEYVLVLFEYVAEEPPQEPPLVANPDYYHATADGYLPIGTTDLLANDTGSGREFDSVSPATANAINVTVDGKTILVGPGPVGGDSLSYTIRKQGAVATASAPITIWRNKDPNNPPKRTVSLRTPVNESAYWSVKDEAGGDSYSWNAVSSPSNGTISWIGTTTGFFEYEPDEGFEGEDYFYVESTVGDWKFYTKVRVTVGEPGSDKIGEATSTILSINASAVEPVALDNYDTIGDLTDEGYPAPPSFAGRLFDGQKIITKKALPSRNWTADMLGVASGSSEFFQREENKAFVIEFFDAQSDPSEDEPMAKFRFYVYREDSPYREYYNEFRNPHGVDYYFRRQFRCDISGSAVPSRTIVMASSSLVQEDDPNHPSWEHETTPVDEGGLGKTFPSLGGFDFVARETLFEIGYGPQGSMFVPDTLETYGPRYPIPRSEDSSDKRIKIAMSVESDGQGVDNYISINNWSAYKVWHRGHCDLDEKHLDCDYLPTCEHVANYGSQRWDVVDFKVDGGPDPMELLRVDSEFVADYKPVKYPEQGAARMVHSHDYCRTHISGWQWSTDDTKMELKFFWQQTEVGYTSPPIAQAVTYLDNDFWGNPMNGTDPTGNMIEGEPCHDELEITSVTVRDRVGLMPCAMFGWYSGAITSASCPEDFFDPGTATTEVVSGAWFPAAGQEYPEDGEYPCEELPSFGDPFLGGTCSPECFTTSCGQIFEHSEHSMAVEPATIDLDPRWEDASVTVETKAGTGVDTNQWPYMDDGPQNVRYRKTGGAGEGMVLHWDGERYTYYCQDYIPKVEELPSDEDMREVSRYLTVGPTRDYWINVVGGSDEVRGYYRYHSGGIEQQETKFDGLRKEEETFTLISDPVDVEGLHPSTSRGFLEASVRYDITDPNSLAETLLGSIGSMSPPSPDGIRLDGSLTHGVRYTKRTEFEVTNTGDQQWQISVTGTGGFLFTAPKWTLESWSVTFQSVGSVPDREGPFDTPDTDPDDEESDKWEDCPEEVGVCVSVSLGYIEFDTEHVYADWYEQNRESGQVLLEWQRHSGPSEGTFYRNVFPFNCAGAWDSSGDYGQAGEQPEGWPFGELPDPPEEMECGSGPCVPEVEVFSTGDALSYPEFYTTFNVENDYLDFIRYPCCDGPEGVLPIQQDAQTKYLKVTPGERWDYTVTPDMESESWHKSSLVWDIRGTYDCGFVGWTNLKVDPIIAYATRNFGYSFPCKYVPCWIDQDQPEVTFTGDDILWDENETDPTISPRYVYIRKRVSVSVIEDYSDGVFSFNPCQDDPKENHYHHIDFDIKWEQLKVDMKGLRITVGPKQQEAIE